MKSIRMIFKSGSNQLAHPIAGVGAGLFLLLSLTSCFGGKETMASGGELTGSKGSSFSEPAPYGMVLIKRGHLKMGMEKPDSLWGRETPTRDISVEGFWMDDTEITNSEYRQFVSYVRDSIIRERLADPNYGGDESYKIEEDKDGKRFEGSYKNGERDGNFVEKNKNGQVIARGHYADGIRYTDR